MGTNHEETEDVEPSADPIAAQRLVRLERGTEDVWEPKPGAVKAVVNRFQEGGGRSRCELYEPETGQWLDCFPVPITRDFILQNWGSGVYQMFYHRPDNQAAGQSRRIELQHLDFPQTSLRKGGFKQRAPVAPPPAVPVMPPRPNMTPKPPPVPVGTDATIAIGLLSWAQDIADTRADQRIISTELYWQTQLAREQAQRSRDIEETESRHRRDREETEARHQRYLAELKQVHDSQLSNAHSTSGKRELQDRLEELEDAVDQKAAEPEPGFMGFLKAAIGPILATPEGQQRIMAAVLSVVQPQPPKLG